MKKIVCIILSVMLVLPTLVTVYAEGGSFYPDAPALVEGVETDVSYDGTEASGAFRFTPEHDGLYQICSYGSYDTYGTLYDADGNYITSNDDSGEGSNFFFTRQLTAGVTYVLVARRYSASDTAEFTVKVTWLPKITDISLSLTDPDATLYVGQGGSDSEYYTGSGYEFYYRFNVSEIFSIIKITATYENGEVKEIGYGDVSYSYSCERWSPHGENNLVTVTADGVSASISVPVASFGEYLGEVPAIVHGEETTVEYDGTPRSGFFRFVPDRDGKYEFRSSGSLDTYGEIYDSRGKTLGNDDDSGEGRQFLVKCDLKAGETYYLHARMLSAESSGTFTATVARIPDITGLTLTLDDGAHLTMGRGGSISEKYDSDREEYVYYYHFYEDALFGLITITAEFEDGTSREIDRGYDELTYQYDCSTWTVGGENVVTVNWRDVSASVSIPIGYYAELFPDAPVMQLDTPVPVGYDGNYDVYTVFTPSEGGVYYFYSEGDADTVGDLYGGESARMRTADDGGTSLNFVISAELEAGVSYVLKTRTYDYKAAEYSVVVSRVAPDFAAGYDALEGLDLSGKMINIVFVVDTTGSMGWVIDNVRNTLQDFVTALAGTNARLRISLIDYKDIIEDPAGPDTTVIHYSPREGIWYENAEIDDILAEISTLRADGGGNRPESVIDALGNVVEPETMTFNSDAAKFVFLLTDADYREENTHGIENMAELIESLADIGVATSVITVKDYFSTYGDLVTGTGGVLINLSGDFAAGMGSFAAAVASAAADYVPEEGVVPVTGISFGEDLEIPVGKIRSFTATVSPANATDSRIVWSVENESIARVSPLTTSDLLVLRGISTGSTRVIARSMDGGYAAYFDLTVSGIVEDGNTIEGCDIGALVDRADDLKDKGLSADLIYYSEAGDEPVMDGEQTEVFSMISGTRFSVSFVYDDEFGDMMYTWRFAGDEIERPAVAIDMDIIVEDPGSPSRETVSAAYPGREFRTVDFLYEGVLPGPAEIKVVVDLPDGVYDLYYFNPGTVKLEDAGKATVADGIATFTITHCSGYVIVSDPTPKPKFVDVPDDAYYAPAVDWAVEKAITTGTSATTFSPEDGCTRGHVVTFLWRAAGSPEPAGANNPFKDVKSGEYYYKAVLWAVEKGITKGTDTTHFSPDETCTRGQIVTFLYRFSNSPSVGSGSNPFSDVSGKDYFYDPVLWAVDKGITKGTDASHFSPEDTCTRGQVVTFLYRAKTGS